MAQSGCKQVFICYAHENADWRDRFERMFAPACSSKIIDVWSDTLIKPGENWNERIDEALARTDVALLLVTDHFFDSEFIASEELARFLSAADKRDVTIQWVPVTPTLHNCSQLGALQAAAFCDPARPLSTMNDADQDLVIQKLCNKIVEDFGNTPRVRPSFRKGLEQKVQSTLGSTWELDEELASGKFAVFYKAHRIEPRRTVGVKTFVISELDEWVRRAFEVAVKRAMNLTSPAFIKVHDYRSGPPDSVVMEFVEARQLDDLLAEYPEGLPLNQVKSILVELARAIEEAHRMDWRRGEMCPSDILIEDLGVARLSALDCTNILREHSLLAGNFLVDVESLAYMTPERYHGRKYTKFTDQYSLGLIATELLGGPSVPRVVKPSDLEGKTDLFKKLQSGEGSWMERSPALAGVVRRMLHQDPERRWPSMSVARELIEGIDMTQSSELQRKMARESYLRLQAKGAAGEQEFYAAFYENLFAAAPDVRHYFDDVDMSRQFEILNMAIYALVDFDVTSANAKENLELYAKSHVKFRLTQTHYKDFLEAFLKTLEERGESRWSLKAWRATLWAGLHYMWQCQEKHTSAAISSAQANRRTGVRSKPPPGPPT